MPCPLSHISKIDSFASSSPYINPFFLRWKQQDQIILNVLLFSLSIDVMHLMVNCQTSHCVWCTLEQTLAFSSNSCNMQLHRSFHDLWQGNASFVMYMQQEKSLLDELLAAGWPFSLEDFNLYVFRELRGDFKDLVTSLVTKVEPLSYTNPHSHLLTHNFLHKTTLQSKVVNPHLLLSANLTQYQNSPNFSHNISYFLRN